MDENQVETLTLDSVVDDAPQGQEENVSTLDTIVEEPEQQAAEETVPAKEPGWIKQRVGKAVEKAVKEAEQRVRAEYEAMLAPIREDVMDRQARELVSSGEFKTLERAKEYIRLKNGVPVGTAEAAAEASAPTRDEKGRFVAKPTEPDEDPVVTARADLLARQAQKLKERGLDVMQVFNSNPDVKQKVLSGEWDFHDVAETMSANNNSRRAPAPMRTSNGGGLGGGISISNMTDEQFRKLQENLSHGRRYDVSK